MTPFEASLKLAQAAGQAMDKLHRVMSLPDLDEGVEVDLSYKVDDVINADVEARIKWVDTFGNSYMSESGVVDYRVQTFDPFEVDVLWLFDKDDSDQHMPTTFKGMVKAQECDIWWRAYLYGCGVVMDGRTVVPGRVTASYMVEEID